MNFFKLIVILLILIAFNGCSSTLKKPETETFFLVINHTANTIDKNPKQLAIHLKRLTTYELQLKGLMFQSKLHANTGVLLEYQSEAARGIWMKNMLIPIDVIFLNKTGRITRLIENLQPCNLNQPCLIYSANQTQFIIELPSGFIKHNKVKIHNTVLRLVH